MKCLHIHRRNVYGDEIIARNYRRQVCVDCGKSVNKSLAVGRGSGIFMDTASLLNYLQYEMDKIYGKETNLRRH